MEVSVIFQQDRAPLHYNLKVREAFNNRFPGCCIGRIRSIDMTYVNFFFWFYIRNIVYTEKIEDLRPFKKKNH